MGLIISSSDFTGRYTLPINQYTQPIIDDMILKHEQSYLRKLLGVTLFDLFKTAYLASIATPTPVPMPARFQKIFDAFAFDDEDYGPCESPGMKMFLVGIVYFHCQREIMIKSTTAGPKTNKGEVVIDLNATQADIYGRYNDSVRVADAIQRYIELNEVDYPEYKGVKIEIAHQWY